MYLRDVTEMLLNPIIQTRTRYFRHSYTPTRDHMYIGATHLQRQFSPNP
jgi:hypothetical protein